MERNSRIIAVLLVLTAVVACSVIMIEDADAASGDRTVRVYADVDGRTVEMSGTGGDLAEAIRDAVSSAGYTVNLGPVDIISFNGQDAEKEKYWTIQQWQPPKGWKVINLNDGQADFVNGTSYYLYMAEGSTESGIFEYSSPDYEPQGTAYFYIRMVTDVEANGYVNSILTKEQRSEGFWISGTGSDLAEAMIDACEKLRARGITGFQLEINDDKTNDLYGWLGSFMGLDDENIPGSTSWNYWSQFNWDESVGSWDYNDWCLGYYDPSVTSYFAVVRQITSDEHSAGVGVDVTPSDIPSELLRDSCTVRFVDGDGKTVKTQTVPYFGSVTAPSTATKSPSGGVTYKFTGWDQKTDQVISDMTVTAVFESSGTPVGPGDEGVKVTGVSITSLQRTMEAGESFRFVAEVTPSNAENRAVTWSTSNPSVATVDSAGNVTAVSAGKATITVTTVDGGRTASVELTVTGSTESIELNCSFVAIAKGDRFALDAEVKGSGNVRWASSNPSVATVDGGVVTMVSDSGSAVITATIGEGLTAECKVVALSGENVDELASADLSGTGDDTYTVVFREGQLEILNDAGKGYTLVTDLGRVELSPEVLDTVGADGNLIVSLAQPNRNQEALVGDNVLYEYRINDGNVSELGGTVRITMPFTLGSGENPDEIRVYCIDSVGSLEEFGCSYSEGEVSFETTHFSLYFATTQDLTVSDPPSEGDGGSGDSTMLYIGIAAVIVVIVAAAAVMMRRHA